jgi:ribosomal protein L32
MRREEISMTNDLFGNFGGLMRGLSGFMPQDDPDVKIITLQSEIEDLKRKETEILAWIGRRVLAENTKRFSEQEEELSGIRDRLADTEKKLTAAKQEKKQTEQALQQEEALHTCPQCGCRNADGVKFCRECGAKLGPVVCKSCGARLLPGERFCGECGTKQEE